MSGVLATIIILLVAFTIPGIINRIRARLAGRKGVTMFQHIINVELLFRKGAVYSPTTTVLFRVVPSVYLASTLVAMLMIPVGSLTPVISFEGDVIMFCYLLGLGRVAMILAAMDTGSSFEGMGASREALYGALIEPALFLVLGTLAMISGRDSFATIFGAINADSPEKILVLLLIGYAMVKIFTVESGRMPIDDPRTHLELTMIHEVMVLDYCGVDLAMINLATWIKGGAIAVVAANSVSSSIGLGVAITVVLAMLVGVIVGVAESMQSRLKLTRNATFIMTISAVAMLIILVSYLLLNNILIE